MTKVDQVSTPIMEAWTVFRLHCKAQRFRTSTLDEYRKKLLPFLEWLVSQEVTALNGITAHHIRAYLVKKQTIAPDTKKERPASGHYIHGVARCIKAFLNFCIAEEFLAASPMATVRMPKKPKKILDALAPEEIKKLFKVAEDDRERALIYVLLDTGIRATECTNIRIGDINIEGNSIAIRAGKGEKDRSVYFGAKTARHLIRLIRDKAGREPLWVNERTGKPLTYWGLAIAMRDLGNRAGVQCNPHKFRRTFAINSLRNGMNIYTLARLMGHEDISILRPYLDLLEVDLRGGHQQYGVVDNL